MKITRKEIKVRDLVEGYKDLGDDGVFTYGDRLVVRPAYQREFVYNEKQREAVMETISKGFPLNVMYRNKIGEDKYEILDGQQRTISIGQYHTGVFSFNNGSNPAYFDNLTEDRKNNILDYTLDIYVCEGNDSEKLDWFRIINTQGEVLTNQELLNAAYTGPFLSSAKIHFSKRNCPAVNIGEGYIKGNPIRQDILEKVLIRIKDRDGLEDHAEYMALHQHDKDYNDLRQYYNQVINWVKMIFINHRTGITDNQERGFLYNKYKDKNYNSNTIEQEIKDLIDDDEVGSNKGIVQYLLSDRNSNDERYLSLRAFTNNQKDKMYQQQEGICPICRNHFDKNEMEADHIIPRHAGGKTELSNGQMLCRKCNRTKSGK